MDAETDLSTTEMLRAACSSCTLLTIAHRLHTIIDYHRIAVMDAGRAAEFKHLSGVSFVAEIPKSAAGKILRRVLRDQHNAGK